MKAIAACATAAVFYLGASPLAGDEEKSMPKEVRQYLKGWVGEYNIEGMWGDTPVTGRLSARRSRGRHANLYDWSFTIGGENGKTLHISTVEGWDPAGGWTIEQGVASDGEIFTTHWTRKGDNLWVGEAKGVAAGQSTSNKVTVKKTADGFTVKVTENKRGDTALPDIELKYTRVSGKRKDAARK